jgi:hypothetical protein
MKFLNVVCYCAFAGSIISLPFLLVNWARYMKARPVDRLTVVRFGFPIKSVSFFLISCLVLILVASVMTTYARHDTLEFIKNLSGKYSVSVNDQEVGDSVKVISALREISSYWPHHSHPTKRIRVLIRSDSRAMALELGRDSDNPQEYWVLIRTTL